jgi:hypothetical protein
MTLALDTAARIGEAVLRLSIARGNGVLDEITSDVYLRGLLETDYKPRLPELGDVLAKCEELRRRDAALVSQQRALPPHPIDDRTYRCFQCQDDPNGWIWLKCPGTPCGRRREHAPHAFSVRCPHWLHQHDAAIRNSARAAIEKNQPTRPEFDALLDLTKGTYRYAQAVTQ